MDDAPSYSSTSVVAAVTTVLYSASAKSPEPIRRRRVDGFIKFAEKINAVSYICVTGLFAPGATDVENGVCLLPE